MEADEKACPACAETIKAAARKCKHCGEVLDGSAPRPAVLQMTPTSSGRSEMSPAAYQLTMLVSGCSLVAGIGLFAYAMQMDVTVPVDAMALGISRVANIHLMSQQSNYRNAGAVLAILGFLGIILANTMRPTGPAPASSAKQYSPQTMQMMWVALGAVLFISFLVVYSATKGG